MKRRVLSYLMLMIVTSSLAVRPVIADEPTFPPSAGEASQAEIRALIEQLGDRDTAKRDIATKRLIEIGTPAKAQLEAAIANDSELDVIRRKAKVLLLSIERREKGDRVNAWDVFVSGKSADVPPGWDKLPGWKKFRDAVGDNPDTRKLFVQIFHAEPKLLEIYATDPDKAASLVESLCAKRASMIEEFRTEVPTPSIIAYLLVAGDPEVKFSSTATTELMNMTNMTFGALAAIRTKHRFITALNNGPAKPLLRKLVGRWIHNTKIEGTMAAAILYAAVALDLNEVLPVALNLVQTINTPEGRELGLYQTKFVIYAIGRLGDTSHVKQLEPLLENSTVLMEATRNRKQVDLQVCDLALVALLCLTNQETKDYNIVKVKVKHDLVGFHRTNCFFEDDQQRKQAFAKWHKWRKENPTLSPELIYIASEAEPSREG